MALKKLIERTSSWFSSKPASAGNTDRFDPDQCSAARHHPDFAKGCYFDDKNLSGQVAMWKWLKPHRKREIKDYYSLLGVYPGASQKQIQRAFRRSAQVYHPDTNKDPGAKEKFQELVDAYQALKVPTKRDDYDAQVIAEYCRSVSGSFDLDKKTEPHIPALLRILRKAA